MTSFDHATTLRLFDTYLHIPTIASDITPEIVTQVQSFWRGLGLDFTPLSSPQPLPGKVNNPALVARVEADAGDAPTLLLYGHWDVQPTGDEALWIWEGQPCPPFQPTYFLDGHCVGTTVEKLLANLTPDDLMRLMVVARGASDNKGQHVANILGVLRAKAAGQLRWNVTILLDGEEEVGSPNLAGLVEAHRSTFAADVMIGSDGPKSHNAPTFLPGVRGLLGFVVRCHNRAAALRHSGNYGNMVTNPVLPLTRLLDAMRTHAEAMGHNAQAQAFRADVDRYFDPASSDRARFGHHLYPTFNVNSILSEAATRGQRRTIIPSWAEASIDVRLVPGMDAEALYESMAALVAAANHSQPDLAFSLEWGSSRNASFTSPTVPSYNWLVKQLEAFWQEPISITPLAGGTLPNDIFTAGLGLPSFWLPAANSDNRQHDTNEHLILSHFFRQQDFYTALVSAPYQP